MPTLPKELRIQLARTTLAARDAAERACRAALENLAVHEKDYRAHMSVDQRLLRNRLRARGRALGDTRDERSGTQEIAHLTEHAAYEHWHRLLFTRFLAENHLLHTDPDNGSVPVTLAECEELAPELQARDGFDLACRFAARTLPGVFRTDDPVLHLRLALNDEVDLRKLLDSLPTEVFTATDSLGWTYQFWQEKRKEEVNKSGKKIGADELPAVTQLFTEDYMVEFLLHNTLGAWWAGKLGPIQAATEEEARAKAGLASKDGLDITWTYLRLVPGDALSPSPPSEGGEGRGEVGANRLWRPAAGTFPGWPTAARLITFLDPCMGSGHFLVFALPILARLRMEEEGLSAAAAIHATLRDNLHGLEIDERCAQIAAFNLALTAWKLAGYQPLPTLHVACSGLAPQGSEKDWVALAGDNDRLKRGMARLYALFKDAPVLGSLINPRTGEGDLLIANFHELEPLMEKALAHGTYDDAAQEITVIARGLSKAAAILAGRFTLIATNVPYLMRRKQADNLQDFCARTHPAARGDIATCFVERSLHFCPPEGAGVAALVTPQHWLYLGGYQELRSEMLQRRSWHFVVRLGARGFQTPMFDFNVCLLAIRPATPTKGMTLFGLDASEVAIPLEKALALRATPLSHLNQLNQLANPDARLVFASQLSSEYLKQYADSRFGLRTGDLPRMACYIWELYHLGDGWVPFLGTVERACEHGGRDRALLWQNGEGVLHELSEYGVASIQGADAWGKSGISVSLMGHLPVTLYCGEVFDNNLGVIWTQNETDLPAAFCFCASSRFTEEVRTIDQSLKVTNQTLLKVPFDLGYWKKIAAEKYPHGLPKPYSNDPTQWLFNGYPKKSDQPLHVAVARLAGYRWPRQTGSSFPDCPALGPDGLEGFADGDGIVCLPPINREQPAANRLRTLLAAALGPFDERALLAAAGKKGSRSVTLEDWLRDEFFEQHCDIFHQRPFIWHVWDGRRDGFHALVHYHRLDHAGLQKLTYSYLGDWIRQQEEDAKAEKPGADARLGAARALQAELAKILEGEAPYDLFVRWKPLAKQSIGWHPDLNEGVRLNIRPFLTAQDVGKKGAGVLRVKPNIKWDKDRGKEPQRDKAEFPWFWCEKEPGTDPKPGKEFTGHRWNNVHLTLAAKRSVH